MATGDPRATLADALGALSETLRHHRDLGFTEVSLKGDYLLGSAEALRAQEAALQGCRKCKLCEGRSTIVFGSGTRGRSSSSSVRARAPTKMLRVSPSSGGRDSS